MAYVKTIWVDDETVVTADNMNHIEDGIKNLESVSLLAVSDTAPSECVEGDLYYNTITKKIYQAIDTDTWDSDGTDPLDKILYIVFSTKTTYSLDENGDLISVGGGGDEISIGTTEPVEEEKLWINPEEVPSGSLNPITNEYSVATDKGYSCDFLNGSIVDSGYNANGDYIKYGNGIMICFKTVESTVAITNAWGSYMYEGTQNLGYFPETFISVPKVFLTNASGNGAILESFNASPTTSTAGVIFYCRPDATTRTIKTDVMAIGRWK